MNPSSLSITAAGERDTPLLRLRHRLGRWRALLEPKALRAADAVLLSLLPRGRETNDVMIVRLDAIGDFVLWLDAAKELRRLHPGRRLVLVGNAIWAGLASRMDYWDEVVPVHLSRFTRLSVYRLRVLASVRRRGFVRAVQPTYSRVSIVGDVLIRASRARERVGSAGDLSNMTPDEKRASDRIYTELVPARPGAMMEISRNAEFVSGLARAPVAPACPEIPRLGELPAALRVDGPYLVLFPGASAALRQWPAERFAETANRLAANTPMTTVLCGSDGERALCAEVAGRLSGPWIDLSGRTALWEFVEIVRGARFLLGNETSAVHVAAAVRTPAVCILGGGHYGRFMPYGDLVDGRHAPAAVIHSMACFGCNWICTQPHRAGGPVPCITGIAVDEVVLRSQQTMSA